MVENFEDWYERVRTPMHGALSAWCGSADAAADALDEAFVRALERWTRVSRMASPEGWLWRTAANHVRRVAKRRVRELDLAASGAPSERHEQGLAPTDVDLQRAVLALGVRQRTAVALYYLADMSTSDVAAAMGVAPGTVHATLHQARVRLADLLAAPVLVSGSDHPSSHHPAAPTTGDDPS